VHGNLKIQINQKLAKKRSEKEKDEAVEAKLTKDFEESLA
jgi:hypothetical protein